MLRNKYSYKVVEVVVVIFCIFIIIGGMIGYVKNIIKFTKCDFEAPYKAEAIHAVGLITPIGGVIGWMDFGK